MMASTAPPPRFFITSLDRKCSMVYVMSESEKTQIYVKNKCGIFLDIKNREKSTTLACKSVVQIVYANMGRFIYITKCFKVTALKGT